RVALDDRGPPRVVLSHVDADVIVAAVPGVAARLHAGVASVGRRPVRVVTPGHRRQHATERDTHGLARRTARGAAAEDGAVAARLAGVADALPRPGALGVHGAGIADVRLAGDEPQGPQTDEEARPSSGDLRGDGGP